MSDARTERGRETVGCGEPGHYSFYVAGVDLDKTLCHARHSRYSSGATLYE